MWGVYDLQLRIWERRERLKIKKFYFKFYVLINFLFQNVVLSVNKLTKRGFYEIRMELMIGK